VKIGFRKEDLGFREEVEAASLNPKSSFLNPWRNGDGLPQDENLGD
jgi:hypothetical protein